MILCSKSEFIMNGSGIELMSELSMIVNTMNKTLSENLDPELSKKVIMNAVEVGFLSDEEIDSKLKEKANDLLEKLLKGLGE